MKDIKVGDIMTQNPITSSPDITLLECAKLMVKKGTGSLILKESGKIAGIITQDDILWALVKKSAKDLDKIKAGDIATRKVYTITAESSVEDAMKKMQTTKFERLPVVSNGELVGLLTMKDILAFSPGLSNDLRELFEIREETEKIRRLAKTPRGKDRVDEMCEACGNYDLLETVDGRRLCEACKGEM
jgi:CBS domain-containing protein